jgi:hypothetical protein
MFYNYVTPITSKPLLDLLSCICTVNADDRITSSQVII